MSETPLSREEIHLWAQRAGSYLGAGLRTWEIVGLLRSQFSVSAADARKIIARARRMLVAELKRPTIEHLAEAFEFFRAILRNKDLSNAEKIRAQGEIVKLVRQFAAAQADAASSGRPEKLDIDFSRLTEEELRIFCKVLEQYARPRKPAQTVDKQSALDGAAQP